MPDTPYPVDPVLTALVLSYDNRALIADRVCPRVPVEGKTFKWWLHELAQTFTIPDTQVGRTGEYNEVEFNGSEQEASVVDHGIKHKVPTDDITQAPRNFDPVRSGTINTQKLIALSREKRVSDMMFNPANYAVNNKMILSGTDQFSDFVGSSPIDVIADAKRSMVMTPTMITIGEAVAAQWQRHPHMLKAYNGNTGDKGIVPLDFIRALFEFEEIYVGKALHNLSKKGEPLNLQGCWGKHIALSYKEEVTSAREGMTHCLTGEFETGFVTRGFNRDIGLKGGQDIRVAEQVKELITAPDLGYLIQNVVA